MKRAQLILLILAILFIVIQQAESQLPAPNVFAVRGTVYVSDGTTPAGSGFTVAVENVTKGLKLEDTTGAAAGPSQYVVTFTDLNNPVVDLDDLIRVTVTQVAAGDVLATKQVTVAPADLEASFLVVDLNFTSGDDGAFVFAIFGRVLLPDGSPAGDGLTVTVENLSKKIEQTDLTGAFAGPSRYVVTFVNTSTPVAEVGDEVQVRVTDSAEGVLAAALLGSTRVTLSPDAVSAGSQEIDVTLTDIRADTQVFAVRGAVFAADGTTPAGNGLRVTVENKSKGLSQAAVTGTFAPSQYVTTFLDTANSVAEAGDEIEVRVEDSAGNLLGDSKAELTSNDINAGFLQLDVPTEPLPVFVVRGTIFAYDETTLAGDGLEVTVANVTKNLTETDITGDAGESGQYSVGFVGQNQRVADPGDTIQVQVRDGNTSILLAEMTSTLEASDIDQDFVVIDVMLPPFPWEPNGDRVVNIFDLVIVAGKFGQSIPDPPPDPNPDVNGDGVVNIFDLVIIAGRFGQQYNPPPAAPALQLTNPTPALLSLKATRINAQRYRLDLVAEAVSDLAGFQFDLAFQPNELEIITVTPGSLLEEDGTPIYWKKPEQETARGKLIGAAGVRLSSDGVSHSGILASIELQRRSSSDLQDLLPRLQNLHLVDSQARLIPTQLTTDFVAPLTTPLPAKPRLLRNYPNPFNPETWIPYHLAKASSVSIEIYDARGHLVRSLNLGIQPAGVYEERGHAAFWDGRNSAGESVSSGVYFYSLRTEDFHATQKMIVAK